jgi:predicted dehydrogenase
MTSPATAGNKLAPSAPVPLGKVGSESCRMQMKRKMTTEQRYIDRPEGDTEAQPPIVNVVVAGLGKQAEEHDAVALAALRDVRTVGFVDPDMDRARRVANRFASSTGFDEARSKGYRIPVEAAEQFADLPVYPSLAEMARDLESRDVELDAVFSVVHHDAHEEVSLECHELGFHHRGQKPMAPTLDACERMVQAARDSNTLEWTCYQYAGAVPWAEQMIASGELGRLTGAHLWWRRQQGIPDNPEFWNAPEKGVRLDEPGHMYAPLLRLWPSRPVWVEAEGSNRHGRRLKGDRFLGDDTFRSLIGFEDGTTALVPTTWIDGVAPDEELGLRVYGEDGGIVNPFLAKRMDRMAHPLLLHRYAAEGQSSDEGETRTGGYAMRYADAYVAAAADFISAVRGGPVAFTAEDGLNVERLVAAAGEARRDDRRVYLPA